MTTRRWRRWSRALVLCALSICACVGPAVSLSRFNCACVIRIDACHSELLFGVVCC